MIDLRDACIYVMPCSYAQDDLLLWLPGDKNQYFSYLMNTALAQYMDREAATEEFVRGKDKQPAAPVPPSWKSWARCCCRHMAGAVD